LISTLLKSTLWIAAWEFMPRTRWGTVHPSRQDR
jgi:hypothetical protein